MPFSRIKIVGAGSIGNHIAHAARRLGWEVVVSDVDPAALQRMQTEIYPKRYGAWDPAIDLFEPEDVPNEGFDLIVIGTPPDSHIGLTRAAVAEGPAAVLVEKPLCGPDLEGLADLARAVEASRTRVFIGYDHVVGSATAKLEELLDERKLGRPATLDVEFREHWGGIFAAHPWLDGPKDSYLGFSARGGGALGEHSHALNLWQHLALHTGAGPIVEVSAMLDRVDADGLAYDRLACLTLRTEAGMVGRAVQDVVTRPPRKWARLQWDGTALEWQVGVEPGRDRVRLETAEGRKDHVIENTRPQDFIRELSHVAAAVEEGRPSPIDLERGLFSMRVIAAAHLSARERRVVRIDRAAGYSLAALG